MSADNDDAAAVADGPVLDGIPGGLTEWERARVLQSRAAKSGFDWPDPSAVVTKLYEEIDEVMAEFRAL